MEDSPDALRKPVTTLRAHSQPGLSDVPPDRDGSARPRLSGAQERLDDRVQAGACLLVAPGADQDVHRRIVAFEQPRKELPTEKPGAAGQKCARLAIAHAFTLINEVVSTQGKRRVTVV